MVKTFLQLPPYSMAVFLHSQNWIGARRVWERKKQGRLRWLREPRKIFLGSIDALRISESLGKTTCHDPRS